MSKFVIYSTWNFDPKHGTGVAIALTNIIKEFNRKNVNYILIKENLDYKYFFGFLLKRIFYNYISARKINKFKYRVLMGVDFDGFKVDRKNTKYILNLRTNFSEIKEFEKGFIKLGCIIEEYFQKKAVKNADQIIVASNYTKNAVIKNYGADGKKIQIIPNGIDNKIFMNNKIKVPEENIILSVSNLFPRKGIKYLIIALKILKDRGIKFKHIHIGKGVLENECKKLASKLELQDEVEFIGGVSDRNKIAQIYRNCKIFCHPCLQEDFGNVFLEAMASGKPIMTFDNSTAREFIKNGRNGFIVPTKDVTALADRIERLFKDKDLCLNIGNINIKEAKKYSWNKTAKKFIKILTKKENDN